MSNPNSERNKAVVRRLVDEVLNGGRLEVVDELYAPRLAAVARRWIAPFRASFPDMRMEVVDLIAEDDKVVVRWTTHVTHQGEFLGVPPTGQHVTCTGMSMYRIANGTIAEVWANADTLGVLQQLGVIAPLGQGGP